MNEKQLKSLVEAVERIKQIDARLADVAAMADVLASGSKDVKVTVSVPKKKKDGPVLDSDGSLIGRPDYFSSPYSMLGSLSAMIRASDPEPDTHDLVVPVQDHIALEALGVLSRHLLEERAALVKKLTKSGVKA